MSRMKVNEQAVKNAKALIEKQQYDKESDWSEAQPSARDKSDFLERHSWDDYAKWFLAIDTEAGEETKDHYNFPYGDFQRVHRDGLIAAKQRAAQYEHSEIRKVADELLSLLDEAMAEG